MLDNMFWRREWHGAREVEVKTGGSGGGTNGVVDARDGDGDGKKEKDDSVEPADERPDMRVQVHHGCNCRIEC